MSDLTPIPEGFTAITPYVVVERAAEAIELYGAAFGAEEIYRLAMPDGSVAHAELRIGGAALFVAQASAKFPASQSMIALYVEDCDASYARALSAGFEGLGEPKDQFYGDRVAKVKDPFGQRWSMSTRIERVSPAQIVERMEAMLASKKG